MSSGKLAELRKLRFRDGTRGHWCLKDAEAGEEGELIQKGVYREEGTTTHFSILDWRILWTKEPDRLQFMELQRVGQD